MIIELDDKDVTAIAQRVLEVLKPHLKPCQHEEPDKVMTISDLSAYLGVTKKWVYEQTASRAIPHIKMSNKQLRFLKKDVDLWLDSLKRQAFTDPTSKLRLIK